MVPNCHNKLHYAYRVRELQVKPSPGSVVPVYLGSPLASCREAFRELKIMTVINLYILEVVSYAHIKMPSTVRSGVQIHQYNTRHATNYCLSVHTHASAEKKPSYIGAKIWNSLPEALKRIDRQRFRKDLRAWLQDNPFYSVTEFFEWRPQNNP
ncbi:hypothetical protein J6590_023143 [Homalodisca vitripennis]|nr:hypothetical protein J6590_023143 [Homalodisca vitripennis]